MSDMYYYDNLNPNLEFVMSWYNDKILPTNEEISEVIKNEKYVAFQKLYEIKEKMDISTKKDIREFYKTDFDDLFLIIFAFMRDDSKIRNKINKTIFEFDIKYFILNIYFINSIIYEKYSSIN